MNSIYQQLLADFLTKSRYPLKQIPNTILPVVEYPHFGATTPWIKAGETLRYLTIVLKGGARMYYHDQRDGREITSRAIGPMELMGCVDCFILQEPMPDHVTVFHGTVLATIGYSEFSVLCKSDPAFTKLIGAMLIRELALGRERERNLKVSPVQERLRPLYRRFPQLGIYLDNDEIGSKVGISSKSVERFRKDEAARR